MLRSLLKTWACSSLVSLINIVKRPFTTNGEFYAVGTVIADPTAIRLYKSKVREGKIVEVNEHNLPKLTEWLESRTGIDFTESFEAALEEALKPKDEVPTPVVTKPEEPVVPTGGVIEGDLPILGDNGKGEVIIPLSEVTKLEVSAEVAKTLPPYAPKK